MLLLKGLFEEADVWMEEEREEESEDPTEENELKDPLKIGIMPFRRQGTKSKQVSVFRQLPWARREGDEGAETRPNFSVTLTGTV